MNTQPKYTIGAVVWTADTEERAELLPCPDCLGTKEWKLVTPAGDELAQACPRCQFRYAGLPLKSLVAATFAPKVRSLTICRVRSDWQDDVCSFNYMALETSSGGSGHVYDEDRLFPSEADATAEAERLCAARLAAWNAKPEVQWEKTISAYRILDAVREQTRKTLWDTSYHFGQLRAKVKDFLEEHRDDISAEMHLKLREMLDEQEHGYHPDHNPVVQLVKAARRIYPDAPDGYLKKALEPFDAIVPEDK